MTLKPSGIRRARHHVISYGYSAAEDWEHINTTPPLTPRWFVIDNNNGPGTVVDATFTEAIAIVQGATAAPNITHDTSGAKAGGTAATVVSGVSGNTEGDLMIVSAFQVTNSTAHVTNVSDSAHIADARGWQQIGTTIDATNGLTCSMWWCRVGIENTGNITLTWSASVATDTIRIVVDQWASDQPGSWVPVSGTYSYFAGASSTTFTYPSIQADPNYHYQMYWGHGMAATNPLTSLTSGFSQWKGSSTDTVVYDIGITPGATYQPTGTQSAGTSRSQGCIFTYVPTQRNRAIGYVNSCVQGTTTTLRTAAAIEADIDKWYSLYPTIDGILFDNCVMSSAGNTALYSTIYNYAKAKASQVLIVGNVAWWPLEAYITTRCLDIYLVNENDYTDNVDGVAGSNWLSQWPSYLLKYGINSFGVMVGKVPDEATMKSIVSSLLLLGIGWFHFGSDTIQNTYGTTLDPPAYQQTIIRVVNGYP